tara:strand:+ start:149 stop:355 length:207 start_codon:yes stop_codon:yes gene_type:complete
MAFHQQLKDLMVADNLEMEQLLEVVEVLEELDKMLLQIQQVVMVVLEHLLYFLVLDFTHYFPRHFQMV